MATGWALMAVWFLLGLASQTLALEAQATPEIGRTPIRPVGDAEVRLLSDYGKQLLKDRYNLDLDNLTRLKLLDFSATRNEPSLNRPAVDLPAGAAALAETRKMDFNLSLVGSASNFVPQDPLYTLPLSVCFRSQVELFPRMLDLQTEMRVPLSRDGEFSVDSSLALPELDIPVLSRLLRSGGLDSPLMAEGSMHSRTGFEHTVGYGLSTHFWRDWDLRYRYEQNLGGGAETHHIGVGRSF